MKQKISVEKKNVPNLDLEEEVAPTDTSVKRSAPRRKIVKLHISTNVKNIENR